MPKKSSILSLDNLRYGIEIEVEFPKPEESEKLIEKHRVIKGWDIDYDGSLENGAEYRPENKNKLYFNEDSLDQIKEILGLIGAHKGFADKNCGLHIHVDISKFTDKQIVNIIKSFIKEQNSIIKKFKPYKSRLDFHCQEIPNEIIKELSEKVIKNIKSDNYSDSDRFPEYFISRHYMLNLQSLASHKTLEFRLFNCTLDPDKIKAIIKWTLEFCINNAKS